MDSSIASEKEWNKLRNAFQVSLMAETSLSALAQNLEAGDWPIPGTDETPSKYIVYSWAELQQLPAFRAQPMLIELLMRVMKDTLAFDAPFEEMVEASQDSIEKEFSGIKTLKKLEIPEEFPIALTALSAEAKDLCKSQGFRTLGEYVRLSQKFSQLIIMEGDFKAFLNSLNHLDEATIARYLPFRCGSKGLHLAEAIGAIVRSIPEAELCALARNMGFKQLSAAQQQLAAAVSKSRLTELDTQFRTRLTEQLTWFKEQAQEWHANQAGNNSLAYRLRVLNDPMLEAVALGLVQQFFAAPAHVPSGAPTATATAAAAPASQEQPSFWARLRRLFGAG